MRNNRPVIELPRVIDIKLEAIDNIVNSLENLRMKGNTMIVVDKITKKIAGERVNEIVSEKYNAQMVTVTDATIDEANRVKELYSDNKIDFAIAVGGGSVIDVTKYSSFHSDIPFISVPTAASHDGIASARASLLGTDKKHSFEAHSPIGVVGDIRTISQAPARFAISGSADLLSNITAIRDWELSNRITGEHISQYAVALSQMTAETIIKNADIIAKDKLEGSYIVLKGLITSSMAMCIAGTSRPASGAEHMISHLLDQTTKTKGLHGEQCGLASVISMYLHGGNWRELKTTLSTIGAPLSFSDINIESDELIYAMLNAQNIRKDRYTILSGGLSQKAAELAMNITGIY